MDLEDIMELQEPHSSLPEMISSYNYHNDYITQFQDYIDLEDYDLIMRISGLQDPQPAEISSRSINTGISHVNLDDTPHNQPHDSAEGRCDQQQSAALQISSKIQHYRPFQHSNVNEKPEDFATARRMRGDAAGGLVNLQGAFANDHKPNDHNPGDLNRIYQQAAARREVHLQNYANDASYDYNGGASAEKLGFSANEHKFNDQIDYTAGSRADEVNYGGAASLQRQADHFDDDDRPAGVSSEEELAFTRSSSSCSSTEKQKKRRKSGTSSSCKPIDNKKDSKPKLHRVADHSTMIKKRAPPFIPPPQHRRPIITYTYSPKIIHTTPSSFMWLIQSLTGSPRTRSRCFQNRPSDHLLHDTTSAASMEAQVPITPHSAHALTYHHDDLAPMQANPMETAPYHHDKYHASHSIFPVNYLATPPNYSFNHMYNVTNTPCKSSNHNLNQSRASTNSLLMQASPCFSSQAPANLSPKRTNHFDFCSNTDQSSSSTSYCSTFMEISPRGPFCERECSESGTQTAKPSFILAGGAATITPPAPKFESWPLNDLIDNNKEEGSVHSRNSVASHNPNFQKASPNYLISNPNHHSNYKPSVNCFCNHNADLIKKEG